VNVRSVTNLPPFAPPTFSGSRSVDVPDKGVAPVRRSADVPDKGVAPVHRSADVP
jgi:hypothetical protein